MDSVAGFVEKDVSSNWGGTQAMDRFAENPDHLGQFNHPGYGNEPRTGDDADHLYPYSPARDRVFRLIEVNDDRPAHWDTGVAQYNVCLRQGYHRSPVVGTDIHNTKAGLTGQARTVVVMPSTVGLNLWSVAPCGFIIFAWDECSPPRAHRRNHLEPERLSHGPTTSRPQGAPIIELSASCNNSHVAMVQLVGGIKIGEVRGTD